MMLKTAGLVLLLLDVVTCAVYGVDLRLLLPQVRLAIPAW
jgi:hypothetical protein